LHREKSHNQALESKLSKEIHDKTTLQADKATLLAELKDEQVKCNALSKEVFPGNLLVVNF
jgi:hypothetical protein